MKMMGNASAVSKQSIWFMPPDLRLKLLPSAGNHSVSNCKVPDLPNIANDINETASVTRLDNIAQLLANFSSLMKKPAKPVSNGTNMNKTRIMFTF